MSELREIFNDIDRVNWRQLVHAYGRATDVPAMLWKAVSDDQQERSQGWDGIWGSLNHQGDFYDSTVATIPFFIRFLTCEEVPDREGFLAYLYSRFLDAANYGGDPFLDEPPGGEDPPTPMLTGDEPPQPVSEDADEEEEDEPDWDNMRSMDLCAWQTGRAILAGKEVYQSLLNHPHKELAGNVANLLLLWHDTRPQAQEALRKVIDAETEPAVKAELLLKYGVYASENDLPAMQYWTASTEPLQVRVAAAICWARVIDPAPLPEDVLTLLEEATATGCSVFEQLPWVGAFSRGLWKLPGNIAHVLLPLAQNDNDELRWRAVQGLMPGRDVEQFLDRKQTTSLLLVCLQDDYDRVRAAAALALGEIGAAVAEYSPNAVEQLILAVGDADADTAGHASRLLAMLGSDLTATQKPAALKATKAAVKRFKGSEEFVHFMSVGIQAERFIQEQYDAIKSPQPHGLAVLWEAHAFPDRQECALKPLDVCQQLAAIYKQEPQQTIATAIDFLHQAKNRNATMGAARWLSALGPAAEPALDALAGCSGGKLDDYAENYIAGKLQLIQQAIAFTAASSPDELPDEDQQLIRDAKSAAALSSLHPLLKHANWLVRFEAARAIAATDFSGEPAEVRTDMQQKLVALLDDTSSDEIAVAQEYQHEDGVYFWRRQRRSLAGAAVRALFALGGKVSSSALLEAMLREATAAQLRCGDQVAAGTYSRREWRAACDAAPGGLIAAEKRVRQVQQQHHSVAWSGDDSSGLSWTASHHLQTAIVQLSGRLVPHDDF